MERAHDCGNCKFGEPSGDLIACRRYPPTPVMYVIGTGRVQRDHAWPKTSPSQWCGEHQSA